MELGGVLPPWPFEVRPDGLQKQGAELFFPVLVIPEDPVDIACVHADFYNGALITSGDDDCVVLGCVVEPVEVEPVRLVQVDRLPRTLGVEDLAEIESPHDGAGVAVELHDSIINGADTRAEGHKISPGKLGGVMVQPLGHFEALPRHATEPVHLHQAILLLDHEIAVLERLEHMAVVLGVEPPHAAVAVDYRGKGDIRSLLVIGGEVKQDHAVADAVGKESLDPKLRVMFGKRRSLYRSDDLCDRALPIRRHKGHAVFVVGIESEKRQAVLGAKLGPGEPQIFAVQTRDHHLEPQGLPASHRCEGGERGGLETLYRDVHLGGSGEKPAGSGTAADQGEAGDGEADNEHDQCDDESALSKASPLLHCSYASDTGGFAAAHWSMVAQLKLLARYE